MKGTTVTIYPDDIVDYLDSESVRDWLNSADEETESEQIAALTAFADECESNVGEHWSAYDTEAWNEYCMDLASEMFGDAVLQDAWDDHVWTATCKTDQYVVTVGHTDYVVVED